MKTYEGPLPQCGLDGCAGRILAYLRERGVAVRLPSGELAPFQLDAGILMQSWTAEAEAWMRQHTIDVARHRQRISLLLLAELAGLN